MIQPHAIAIVDLAAGPRPRAGASPEQLAAHARLAAVLPRWGHVKPAPVEHAPRGAAKGGARKHRGASISLPGSRSSSSKSKPEPKDRKKRTSFVILAPRPNRWGFKRGDLFAVTGGPHKGSRGLYHGAGSSTHVVLIIDGERHQVGAHLIRRIEG